MLGIVAYSCAIVVINTKPVNKGDVITTTNGKTKNITIANKSKAIDLSNKLDKWEYLKYISHIYLLKK